MTDSQANGARLSLEDYARGVKACDVAVLARAITLVESQAAKDKVLARKLLETLLPDAGNSIRVGITGVPGVGKSTLIEALGLMLTGQGHKIAVLAVDPTSARTGGSILGDKTRMTKLARDKCAYIRPQPAGGTMGGVAAHTQEAIALCEAAGFDVVLVETVGTGQSEIAVSNMVDFFLVLMLPGAGDELQGIKRGVLEIADMIAVNKADGDNVKRADETASAYLSALNIITPKSPDWRVPVITCSALENKGLDGIWAAIEAHREIMTASGVLEDNRRAQRKRWLDRLLEARMRGALEASPKFKHAISKLETRVANGEITPGMAADEIAAMLAL